MPIQKHLLGVMAMACLLTLSTLASAQTNRIIYKWTDEKGIVHYEMRKPADQNADVEVIKKKREEGNAAPVTEENSADKPTTGLEAAAAAAAANAKKPAPKDPAVCKLARNNLQELENRRYVVVKDEYGNERILDEQEVANEIQRAREAVKANCD